MEHVPHFNGVADIATKLIKAADWANGKHVDHLGAVTDTATLFLLSADATPEEVREWFMERCAAGASGGCRGGAGDKAST